MKSFVMPVRLLVGNTRIQPRGEAICAFFLVYTTVNGPSNTVRLMTSVRAT